MTKPTAQELLDQIKGEIGLADFSPYITQMFMELVEDYAQAYHEEQMRDFVGIPQGEFTVGFMNPKSPGAIYLKTYPPNPKNNEL